METPKLSRDEALAVVRTMTTHSFACSLVRHIDAGRGTDGRWDWVKTLAGEELVRRHRAEELASWQRSNAEAFVTDDGQMDMILDLFDRCKDKLANPRIRLLVGSENRLYALRPSLQVERGIQLLYYPGAEGRHVLGVVQSDGIFLPEYGVKADDHPGLLDRMLALAQDPEGVARHYGKVVGSCCFCGNTLTDERSKFVGYGETCAKHYQLPWGNRDYSTPASRLAARRRRSGV